MEQTNSKVKVCFVATIPLTLKTFILRLAQYIHENIDWEIYFICDYEQDFENSLPEYIHYYPVHMHRGINFSLSAERQIYKICKNEKFDLIQFCTPNASLYTSIAAARAHVPVRLYCQWGIAYVGFNGLKRKLFKLEEKFVCSRATVIEPDSFSNLNFAVSEGLYKREKGRVVWNGSACGIDLKRFDISKRSDYRQKIRMELGIPDSAFVFGFVGRVKIDKGITELFEAFKKTQNTIEDSYLIVVGADERPDYIENDLFNWANENNRIIFTGYSDKVEQYLSAMDCFVLPSYREGFGLSVAEAEVMGLPVIVTDINGPIDAMVEGQTGIVIPVKDAEALYNAMVELYSDETKRSDLGAAGYGFVRENFEQRELFHRILEDRKALIGASTDR